jgi:4-amino-4-deoxy-L-arabinose transferase-like glycosyltransferase
MTGEQIPLGSRYLRARLSLNSRYGFYAIVSFGLLLRIIPLVMVGGRFLVHENPSYDGMAQQLLAHVSFSPYWPPGLPYYLAFVHSIFGGGMLVARASILAIYVVFSFALYGVVRELSTDQAANFAVLIFALYPSYIRYAFNPSTEYATAACLLVAVYLTILIIRRRWYDLAFLLGLTLGAVALIRANSLGLTIAISVYLFVRTKKWSVAVICLATSFVVISGWLWKAYSMTGRFLFINDSNVENFVFANHPDTPLYVTSRGGPIEPELPDRFLRLAQEIDQKPPPPQQAILRGATLHYVLSRPDLFLLRVANRFRAFFTLPVHHAEPLTGGSGLRARATYWLANGITGIEATFFWPIMALAVIFWFNLPSFCKQVDAAFLIGIAALVYAVPCWLTWSQPRYAFPVIPLFAVFAFVLLDALSRRPWREVLRPILQSRYRMRAMLLTLVFFFCIQIEWFVLFVSSRAWL